MNSLADYEQDTVVLAADAAILAWTVMREREAVPVAAAVTMPEAQQDGQPQDPRLFGKQATTQKF